MNMQSAGSANRNHSVRVPSLFDIFRGKVANGYRRIAQWRREGSLAKVKARQTRRRNVARLETLERRLLLSADLIHTTPEGLALDTTLRVADIDGAAMLRLLDNQSQGVLAERALDQDIDVTVRGNDQSDKLVIGFDRASITRQIRVNFDGGDGGVDELFGANRSNRWRFDAPGAGTLDDGTFTGVERVKGGAADDTSVVNAITIDVEDYFQVSAFAPYISRSAWEGLPQRVEQNVDRILEILEDAGVHATFFTLGWIAKRYPHMVQRIVAQGHELASHGYAHERASALQRDPFFADIALAKAVLEDVGGIKVQGYRAPSFSIGKGNLWAYDCLAEAGYRYSSSVYPIRHDHYGSPDAPRFAYCVNAQMLEVPITTARLFRQNWPAGGGGYFRLMPYAVSRWLIQRVNVEEGESAIFYFHPWEIDPEQPRVNGVDARTRFRHYVNLHRTAGRLRLLLRDFRWDRVDRVLSAGVRNRRRHGLREAGAAFERRHDRQFEHVGVAGVLSDGLS